MNRDEELKYLVDKGFYLNSVGISRKVLFKSNGLLNIRVILTSSCWDVDVYEGIENDKLKYTIDKPKHKYYCGGMYFDYLKIAITDAENIFNSIISK